MHLSGSRGPIDVVMKLDEGKRYRVGKIEFLGLNEKTQNQLTPRLKPGDVFHRDLVDDIFKRNKPLLPSDASWEGMRFGPSCEISYRDDDPFLRFETCGQTRCLAIPRAFGLLGLRRLKFRVPEKEWLCLRVALR
jgi:hypothetical protein